MAQDWKRQERRLEERFLERAADLARRGAERDQSDAPLLEG
jgi:hypothetical protein